MKLSMGSRIMGNFVNVILRFYLEVYKMMKVHWGGGGGRTHCCYSVGIGNPCND